MLAQAVAFSHQLLQSVLQPGDAAVDATCGNGHDTLMLARAVGPSGRVLAMDVQEQAVTATRRRLDEADLAGRVTVMQQDHAGLGGVLAEGAWPAPRAVIFNLGYLPGGDRARITRPASTLPAAQAALDAVLPGGLVILVCYPGHPGGDEEAGAVENWAAALPDHRVLAAGYRFLNQTRDPPLVVAVERRK